ncbi:MAG: glutathionylspermidine synthase family protein [Magnetovibrionaceae bacterium]
MKRLDVTPRSDWIETAEAHGFDFHSIDGDPYWDESAAYAFTLEQIETDLEEAVEALEELCFQAIDHVVENEEKLARLHIPEDYWDLIKTSWEEQHRNLYGRMDFAYDGTGPAKLYEYNADTPTSLYESSIFQWVWLEQAMERGIIPAGSDQFNSLHERLIEAMPDLAPLASKLHFTCAVDSAEDKGTVEYLEDCAKQAGLETGFLYMNEIGIDAEGVFTDLDDYEIQALFKLYPWEWLFQENFAVHLKQNVTRFIEPAWKSILSNKGLMALLWEGFPGHPNLLPCVFEDDPTAAEAGDTFVRKPLYSREGWDVAIVQGGETTHLKTGEYGEGPGVIQAFHPLPDFGGRYPMCGCWLVASQPAGMCIREDSGLVTTDDARFIPHFIRA